MAPRPVDVRKRHRRINTEETLMTLDQRKRQKKVERRNRKQKERKILAIRNHSDVADRIRRAAVAPVLHCCAGESIWEIGIGNVLFSRILPSGTVAFAVF